MISEERLKEIEDRANKATKGPWVNNRNGVYTADLKKDIFVANEMAKPRKVDDAFAAHARTDVPDLIEEVRNHRNEMHSIITEWGKFRHDLRQLLHENGVRSNPAWSEHNIVETFRNEIHRLHKALKEIDHFNYYQDNCIGRTIEQALRIEK